MALVLVRLKLTLLRAGLARSGVRGAVGAGLSLLLSLVCGGIGALVFVPTRLLDAAAATDAIAAGFALMLFVWVLGPILTAGAEGTLEPERLALFPLTGRQLMPGLLLAAVTGFGGVATVVTLAGAVAGMAPASPLVAITLAAAGLQLLLCAAASRLVATAASGAARSRRWRDVVLFAIPATALGLNLLLQVLLRTAASDPGALRNSGAFAATRAVLRALPSSPAAIAMGFARAGQAGQALIALAVAAAVLVVTVALWHAVLERVLTSPRSASGRSDGRRATRLVPRWAPFLERGRTGAVAAKELRLTWRDPRQRAAVLGGVFAAVIPAFSFRVLASESPRIVLVAAIPAYVLAAGAANLYGFDGPAFWTNLAAGDDAASDLAGKSLARAVIVAPLVLIAAAVMSARSNSVQFALPAFGLAVTAFGVNLGLGNVASVLAPVAIPDDRTNIFSAGASGQGLATAGPALAVLFGGMFLVAPLLVPMLVIDSTPVLLALSIAGAAYGLAAWWAGWRVAIKHSGTRQPELLAALSDRQ